MTAFRSRFTKFSRVRNRSRSHKARAFTHSPLAECRRAQRARGFVESQAKRIANSLAPFSGGGLELAGYTPPGATLGRTGYSGGELVLDFLVGTNCEPVGRFLPGDGSVAGVTLCSIAVAFGGARPRRRPFSVRAFRRCPLQPFASGLQTLDFGEAWQIVCRVVQRLAIRDITLRYGH